MKYFQSLTNLNAYQKVRQSSLTISGALCTAGGLVADVLQPLAPFVFYLFILSGVAFGLLGLLYYKGKKELLGALILSGMAFVATGLLSLMQQGPEAEERGIMAVSVPAIASLQDRLGIIEMKLDDIKADTGEIKADTKEIKAGTQEIKDSTARLEAKSDEMLAAIRNGFGSSDGVIANPTSPEEYYHNARIHELAGDYSAARRAYLEYFKSNLAMLDPHLRFITFLKVQEGTAGARETYNEITARSTSPIPAYTRLLLLGTEKRIKALKKYFKENPKFAAVAYHLSLEYSERRLGSQTIGDKREELYYLKAFQERDENGGLMRYIIDQELVSDWRADVVERRVALENGISGGVLENPVSLSWMAHNAGWNGNILISEPAQDIKWRIKGQGQARSTGKSGYNDPRTGQPAPKSFFELSKKQPASTIEIWYTDLQGIERGPFAFEFTPAKESVDANRRLLEMTTTSWLSFRKHNNSNLLYFSHLMAYRGAIEKIQYGLDTNTPNKNFKFSAWNKPGIAPITANMKLYLKVPRGTRYATIQLTYKNGDKSEVIRIDR